MQPTQSSIRENVQQNIKKLQELMKSQGLTHYYLPSSDPYLNEYIPSEQCYRYHFTGFRGSTGEVLATQSEKIKLFVDGRYHEQADEEVDHGDVEVIKVKDKGLKKSVLENLPQTTIVGYDPLRTPLQFVRRLEEKCLKAEPKARVLNSISTLTIGTYSTDLSIVENLEGKVDITSVAEKIRRIYGDFQSNEAIYLGALDQIAWISNLRGHHLPNLSFLLRQGRPHC